MYDDFIARNSMLVDDVTQEKLRHLKILMCGCGIGGHAAAALLRMGCLNFTLVDMDTVSISNLNRQVYTYEDLGVHKVTALKKRLDSIYPHASVTAIPEAVDEYNVAALVADCDIIIDTIDYLDMKAILMLHQQAQDQKKSLISAMSVGFGAGLFYLPPDSRASFKR